ncbi:uncharacterized protein LOC144178569 isoform X2 [Haemaphysalis longicornis]
MLHCQQCSFTTLRPSKMKSHQRIHTGQQPHQCSYCSKAFGEKGTLVAHMCIHTDECPCRCHLCPSAFAQMSHLVTHYLVTPLPEESPRGEAAHPPPAVS